MTVHLHKKAIEAAIKDLLQGPKHPEKEFVRGGATFGRVYQMAADLQDFYGKQQEPLAALCLAVEDKAVLAAALLASLAGGPTLLLPYSFSPQVLAQLHGATGYTTALTDAARDFPDGVQLISSPATPTTGRTLALRGRSSSELLRIFTGGSTGTPQVWSKTAINLFGEGFFLAKRFAVATDDCILATIPPYHIYGLLFSIVLPLVSSATVIAETPSFPEEILQAAGDAAATILISVPAHYRVLRDRRIPLRRAFSSAGMLDKEDNDLFSGKNSYGITEVYGSTETGGIATRNRSEGETFFTPFSTLEWKINDSRLAVKSAFISPELPVDAEGFFTTGDRALARGINQFTLQGRADAITKVGGKRVDLEEITLLIKKEPGVTGCLVIALPETGGREHRIAALIEGNRVDTQNVHKNLAERLEPYALPRRLKVVEKIPVNKNGKYDRPAIVRLLEK